MIDRLTAFKRDFKRELKGRHGKIINAELADVIEYLANDILLEPRYKNHALSGSWNGYYECHIKPDLLLIYKKIDPNILLLAIK